MRIWLLLLIAVVFFLPTPSSAATIQYSAIDLSDGLGQPDLWRYEYTVAGFTLGADQGFTIEFGPDYEALNNAMPAGDPDWSILLAPYDPIFGNGLFNAVAQSASALSTITFSVDFEWNGAGNPGSQPYIIFDRNGGYAELEYGETSSASAVPEPSAMVLLSTGALLLFIGCRRSL